MSGALPAGVIDENGAALPGLGLTRRVLDALDSAGVPFCHWKSNEHLDAALAGQTDLDLLVAAASAQQFDVVARRHGFARAVNAPLRRLEGLEDYLGVDPETGVLVHLHVHYRLVLGEQRVKNHRLPIEDWLLAGCIRVAGVPIPRPEQELLLLYVRSLVKTLPRTALRAQLRGRPHPFPAAIYAELISLQERTTDEAVLAALAASGLSLRADDLRAFLARLRTGQLTPARVLAHKRALLRQLRPYRRYSAAHAFGRKIGFTVRFDRRVQRLWPVPKKGLVDGGVYVALVGADGSGKSRLAGDLRKWLAPKLATQVIYFGQPKNDRRLTMLRRTRKLALRLRAPGVVTRSLNDAIWLFVARHRVSADARARQLVAGGGVAIGERFPLPEFRSMPVPMDGPRLAASVDSPGRKGRAARTERRDYERLTPPELVLALTADFAVLRERKPDTEPGEHADKHAAMQRLIASGDVVPLDTEQPYEDVLLAAKRILWERVLDKRQAAGRAAP